MLNLLTFNYWFDITPVPFILPAKIGLFVFVGLLLLAGLFFFLFRKKFSLQKKMFASLYSFCFSNFIIGLVLIFSEIQRATFLSARFWYLIWFVCMIWAMVNIVKRQKKYLANREGLKKDREFKKYLP